MTAWRYEISLLVLKNIESNTVQTHFISLCAALKDTVYIDFTP